MNFVRRKVEGHAARPALVPPLATEAAPKPSRLALPYRAIEPIAMMLDALAILAASVFSDWYYNRFILEVVGDLNQAVIFGAAVAALFVPFSRNGGLYGPSELLNLKSQVTSVTVIWFSVLLVLAGAVFAFKAGAGTSRGVAASFLGIGLFLILLLRLVWRIALSRGLAQGRITDRQIALIVLDQDNESVLRTLTRHGIRVTQQFVAPSIQQSNALRCHASDQITSKIRGSDAQEIMVVADLNRYEEVSEILLKLKQLPLPVSFMPIGAAADMLTRPTRMIGLSPAFQLQHAPQSEAQQAMKRALDVSLALLGLIALSPVFLITALMIKLDSPGPALFRQRRCGFNGREFVIYKFRSMTVQEDGDDIAQAERKDPRVSRVGAFLRKTSIDELPQLLNVLGGSMSLVGPRPHAVAHDNEYNRLVANYALRHHVKPGLTGWAQIHGFRGRTATPQDMENRVKMDLWYIDNWSFLIDLKILALTPVSLIKSDNAF